MTVWIDQSDETLIRRLTEFGDEQAFAQIVQRYTDSVYRVCYRVLGDRALAEDAVQDTFYKLLRQPAAVRSSLAGWLHRTATHRAVDLIRADARRRRRERAHAEALEDLPETWSDVRSEVDRAVASLPDDLRWLMVQHYLRGRTVRDLGEETRTSGSTVSRRLQDAVGRVRAELRRRGVIAGAAVVAAVLTEAPAEAASLHLAAELGRMQLLAATTASAGAGVGTLSATAVAGLTGALALVGALAVGGILLGPGAGPAAHRGADPPAVTAPTPAAHEPAPAAAPEPGTAVVVGDAQSLQPGQIVLFVEPAEPGARFITVTFGDGHVDELSPQALSDRLLAQTGRDLASWRQSPQPSAP